MNTMVITGATSGVGKELAGYFADKNYRVCAIGRSKENLEELRTANPDNIVPYSCDISNAGNVEKTFSQIISTFKSIDVLINNAAVFQMKNFKDQDIRIIDQIIDTNLKGLMYVTHFALPAMPKSGASHIINIASVAGTRGIPQQAIYCASKHGVVGFGDVLAQELLETGIKVVTICPGGIQTNLWNAEKNPYPGDVEKIMDPKEIVNLIEFILAQPDHTLYKKVIMFPTNEWH